MKGVEHRLRPLLDPRSIAIVGASDNPGRVGGMPFALCLQHGFKGALYPVNPKYDEISGVKCYPDIESIPEAVDLVALAVAAEQVAPQLRRLAARGCRSAVVFASGFAETGEAEGIRLQAQLEATVATLGIPVAGPNCMGFANLNSHAYTAFASVFRFIEPPQDDHSVALITQSGNVCATVYAQARKLGVGFGIVVNTGNEASLEFSEYLEYYAADPAVKTVVGYVEGLRDGDRFRKVATHLSGKGVPLVLLKIGDTEKGAEAAASHTAALSGSQAVYRTVFEDLNVIQADDLTHLSDVAYVAKFGGKSDGARIAILTISGALGALLSDKFVTSGAEVPTLPEDVQKVLRAGIPNYGMVSNPVDLTGNIVNDFAFFENTLAALQASDAIDMIVLYAPGYLLERITPTVVKSIPGSTKLLTVIDTLGASTRGELQAAGVPVFDDTGRAVRALSSWAKWSERQRAGAATAAPSHVASSSEAAKLISSAGERGAVALNEVDGKRLIGFYGAPAVAEAQAATADIAAIAAEHLGYPVVVKVLSADILHKSDCGGVKLRLASEADVRAAFEEVTANARKAYPSARIEGVVVQKMEDPGVEVLIGMTRDPVFGPVITLGLGGIFTEILKDIRHGLLPVTADDAKRMLSQLKGYPLLAGIRGRKRCDIDALARTVAAVSATVLAHPEIVELELNPVVVRPEGEGVAALDCLVTLRHDTPSSASASHDRAVVGG